MRYFCFYFPIRLGVIITSTLSVFQDIAFLIYLMLQESDFIKKITKEFLGVEDELTVNTWVKRTLHYVEKCN